MEMVTHSSTLALKIPWTEEPGGLQSMGLRSRTRLSHFISILDKQQPEGHVRASSVLVNKVLPQLTTCAAINCSL